jgi:hypothetical protein
MPDLPDPRRCPLCGGENACALAAAPAGAPPAECWCRAERFPRELLARVPAAARGAACVCRACLGEGVRRERPGS